MSKGKNVHIAFVCAQYPSVCYLLTMHIVVYEYYSDFDGRQTHVDDGRETPGDMFHYFPTASFRSYPQFPFLFQTQERMLKGQWDIEFNFKGR